MSESIEDYPFLREWLERQSEPVPINGINQAAPSPLTIDCLPEREQDTLFTKETNE